MSRPRDPAARAAGWLLLVTAAVTVVAVIGRVSADADLATLAESLAAIGAHRWALRGRRCGASDLRTHAADGSVVPAAYLDHAPASWARGWCRCCWGFREWPPRSSGAGAVVLAIMAHGSPDGLATVAPVTTAVADLRWISGRFGFSLAGVALIAAALRQWRVGGFLRPLAPATAHCIGVAMQLIWVDAVVVAHRVSGAAFLVWLGAIGVLLGDRSGGTAIRRPCRGGIHRVTAFS